MVNTTSLKKTKKVKTFTGGHGKKADGSFTVKLTGQVTQVLNQAFTKIQTTVTSTVTLTMKLFLLNSTLISL